MAFPDNLRILATAPSLRRRERAMAREPLTSPERPDPATLARRAGAGPAAVRSAEGNGVAFVFQGGGSLTAAQVGMLRALDEAGVRPDLVIGASSGALNAVMFATHPSPAGIDRLEAVWRPLRRRHVAPFSARTLLAAVAGRGAGLAPSSGMRRLIERSGVPRLLAGTSVPAHVVATDLVSGAVVVLSDGQVMPALLASCAFPGLYPPVRVGGRLLVDGGVSADVPVLQAEALGARVTYVLPAATCDVGWPRPRGPVPLAYHALGQLLDAAARGDVAAARGPVHVLPAPGSRAISPVDFRDTARLIDEGYRLAAGWLAGHADRAGPAPGAAAGGELPSAGLPVSQVAGAS